MRLSQVTLDRDMRRPDNSNSMTRAFRAADGYTIDVEEGLLFVRHETAPGVVRVTSSTWITDGQRAELPQVKK